MRLREGRWLIRVLLLLAGSAVCAAEPPLADGGTSTFILENDAMYDIDRHYTGGWRYIRVPEKGVAAPEWAVNLAQHLLWFPDGKIRQGYALGQSVFTPEDDTIPDPPPTDRPYAGWLYGSIGLGVETGRRLDQVGLTLGIVGPAALAEQSQKLVHALVDTDEQQGWDTQLANEPGIVVNYLRSWRSPDARLRSGAHVDFMPHVGAALGNVYTYANAGMTLRYGRHLSRDYGAPLVQSGLPGAADFSPSPRLGGYLFVGVEGRAVAHNIFLDGNTFKDSRSVEKEPLVGDLQFGFVMDWQALRISYTHVIRSEEFATQHGADDFGSLSISVKHK
jgi:lipid A 3-O-deacylase